MRYLKIGFMWFLISCTEGRVPKESPSFELDVKPIFSNRCTSCHGNRWSYKEVVDNIDKIEYKVIKARNMPPQGLSSYEYNTIRNWVNNGKER